MVRSCLLALAGLLCAALLGPPAAASAQGSANVSGIVLVRGGTAPPANAVVTIQLAEVVAGGAAGRVVAEQAFSTNGAQPPFAFTLRYNPALIDATKRYSLQGNIRWGGQVRYSTSVAYPVITFNNASGNIQVQMNSVGAPSLPTTGGSGQPLLLAVALLLAGLAAGAARRRLA
jgi:putative lipoprotein